MSFAPISVTVYKRTPTLDAMGGETETPTQVATYALPSYRVTRNYHRILRGAIDRVEATSSGADGPGVMTRTLTFFTFKPALPNPPPFTVSDYIDDGNGPARITAIRRYQFSTQIDTEVIL